ncbi:hypothetical protein GA0070608_5311 [Micromonospora peucetia]|uniref:Uncharacterized protein n=1 Tax=Micromonospora peucetia TaxID=47871 RepID=A0A1C6W3D2_9ACTN|nr:hypothetical protein GA0070608_5311 [Micromonospora peucetia]
MFSPTWPVGYVAMSIAYLAWDAVGQVVVGVADWPASAPMAPQRGAEPRHLNGHRRSVDVPPGSRPRPARASVNRSWNGLVREQLHDTEATQR